MSARACRVDTKALKHGMDLREVARRLGIRFAQGQERRVEPMVHCPNVEGHVHGDRTASMHLRHDVFCCHGRGCQAKGDVIALVMLARNCDFKNAVAWLDGESPSMPMRPLPKAVPPKYITSGEWATLLEFLEPLSDHSEVRIYLAKRGLDVEGLDAAQMAYALPPGFSARPVREKAARMIASMLETADGDLELNAISLVRAYAIRGDAISPSKLTLRALANEVARRFADPHVVPDTGEWMEAEIDFATSRDFFEAGFAMVDWATLAEVYGVAYEAVHDEAEPWAWMKACFHSAPLLRSIQWWPRSGRRIVLPLYDVRGEVRCVLGRSIVWPSPRFKSETPKGYSAGGLMLACPVALRWLRGEGEPAKVVLTEGEPDWMSMRQMVDADVAVLGLRNGSLGDEFAEDWASKLEGHDVVIATHDDKAGHAYAQHIEHVMDGRDAVLTRYLPRMMRG